jgi:poly-gamma-glutamate capsule biosynthesis protein CapA/YwtB (metallophosphatase superfamily)
MAFLFLVWLMVIGWPWPGWAAEADPGATRARVSVAAVGDLMLGSDFPSPRLPPDDGQGLLDPAKDLFRQADVSFGNLEGVLADGGVCVKNTDSPNVYAFRTPTRFAARLKDAHLKVVSLANNHAMDFGPGGHAATKAALREAGIRFSGKDGEVAEFTVGGVKVGLLAVSFGPPPRSIIQPQEVFREIESLATRYDVLIISIHGGKEGRGALHVRDEAEYFLGEPRGNLVRFARGAVERGADLILGHGPHVPRALEVHQGRLIAYSLGNFCTYKGMSLAGESGLAPLLWVELGPKGEFLQGQIHSFVQEKPGGPQKDESHGAARLMRTLSLEDFPATSPLITATGAIRPLARSQEQGKEERE